MSDGVPAGAGRAWRAMMLPMGTIPRGTSTWSRSLEERIVAAAEAALAARKIVTAVDVFMRIGWLPPSAVDLWRQGRADCLEEEISADPGKLSSALGLLGRWAERRGLRPSEAPYLSAARPSPDAAAPSRRRSRRRK